MARALSHDTRLIVMDEPSAALDQQEVQTLFRVIRDLTAQGVAVVYISHRLEEIRQVGDRVTVLKDGRTVATDLPARETPTSELIRRMTGRQIEYVFPDRVPHGRQRRHGARGRGPDAGQEFADVSFSVRAGEIVGLAGLVGSGRSEILETVYGARRPGQRHRHRRRHAAARRLGRRRGQGGRRPGARGAQEPGPAARPGDLPQHHRLEPRPVRPRRASSTARPSAPPPSS